jgi:NAD-dependent SIR2 family protein deacetylase
MENSSEPYPNLQDFNECDLLIVMGTSLQGVPRCASVFLRLGRAQYLVCSLVCNVFFLKRKPRPAP